MQRQPSSDELNISLVPQSMGQGCRQRVVHCVVEIRGISESPFEFGKHPNGFGSLLDQRLVLHPVTRRQRINVARLAWAPLVISPAMRATCTPLNHQSRQWAIPRGYSKAPRSEIGTAVKPSLTLLLLFMAR
jgi:hypothetical protein